MIFFGEMTHKVREKVKYICRKIIVMALQPFDGPWPVFQFLDPVHSR
jgi:hypothetical protein